MPMVDVLLIIKFISSLEVAQTQMVPYSTIIHCHVQKVTCEKVGTKPTKAPN